MRICAVLTTSDQYKTTRAKWCEDTWLKGFDEYILCATKDDTNNPHWRHTTGGDGYESHQDKMINGLKIALNEFAPCDWYITGCDNTFVSPRNLRKLVDMLPRDEMHLYGQTMDSWPDDRTLHYCSGGGGILGNRLTYAFMQPKFCELSQHRHGYYDVWSGLVARACGIPMHNTPWMSGNPPSSAEDYARVITCHYINDEATMHAIYEANK